MSVIPECTRGVGFKDVPKGVFRLYGALRDVWDPIHPGGVVLVHAMPVDGDSLCRVCIVNVYNESLLVGDDESGGRSESVDGIECAERLAIYCLWGRALGAGAAICHWDHLKRKKRVYRREGGREEGREKTRE